MAVLPALDHRLGHGDPSAVRAELEGWTRVVSAVTDAWGGLGDGVWVRLSAIEAAIELALVLARSGAAVGLAHGMVVDGHRGPPIGGAMLRSSALARAVRQGEVVLASTLLGEVSLPAGVGHFAAPQELDVHGMPLAFVRDYRVEH